VPPGRNDSRQISGYQQEATVRLAIAKVEPPAPVNRYRPHTVNATNESRARTRRYLAQVSVFPLKTLSIQTRGFCAVTSRLGTGIAG